VRVTARSADLQPAGPEATAGADGVADPVAALDADGDEANDWAGTDAAPVDDVPPPWLVQAASRATAVTAVASFRVVLTTNLLISSR
jgi:hypothetical protein